jgi:integrase
MKSGGPTKAEDQVQHRFQTDDRGASELLYIYQREMAYLAAILHFYNRRWLDLALERRFGQELVISILDRALLRYPLETELVFHADCTQQYRAKQMKRLLSRAGMQLSLGVRGNRYDNAAIKSLLSTSKSELVNRQKFGTEKEVQRRFYGNIEVYYGWHRKRRTLDCQTTAQCAIATTHS